MSWAYLCMILFATWCDLETTIEAMDPNNQIDYDLQPIVDVVDPIYIK